MASPSVVLAQTPIVFQEGLTSYPLVFESGDQDRRIEARIEPQPGEVSVANNAFGADLVNRSHQDPGALSRRGDRKLRGCRALARSAGPSHRSRRRSWKTRMSSARHSYPSDAGGDFSELVQADERYRKLPENPSQFFAYDAIILSNVPRDVLSDQHMAWVEEWIGRRGEGSAWSAGPTVSPPAAGTTPRSARCSPWSFVPAVPDWDQGQTSLRVSSQGASHPVWHLSSDQAQNRSALKALPELHGKQPRRPRQGGGRRTGPDDFLRSGRGRLHRQLPCNPSVEAARWP